MRLPLNSSPYSSQNLDQPTLEGLQDTVKQVKVDADGFLFGQINDHYSMALSVLHPSGDPFDVDFLTTSNGACKLGTGTMGDYMFPVSVIMT